MLNACFALSDTITAFKLIPWVMLSDTGCFKYSRLHHRIIRNYLFRRTCYANVQCFNTAPDKVQIFYCELECFAFWKTHVQLLIAYHIWPTTKVIISVVHANFAYQQTQINWSWRFALVKPLVPYIVNCNNNQLHSQNLSSAIVQTYY